MRIAFVSDIHGNLAALEAVAADIERRGVDRVVNLGDNLSGPLLPRQTAQFLMASGWLSLAGNHDREVLTLEARGDAGAPSDTYAHAQLTAAEFDWLRTLRPSARLDDEVFVCHATPDHDCTYFLETVEHGRVRLASPAEIAVRLGGERSPVVACGHTHVPRAVRTASGQLIVNPGSVGLPAYSDDDPEPHVVENGATDTRYAIIERTPAGWNAQLIALPYDYAPMAALARKHHRPDWEIALLTGYAR
ncbi:MAG TPA: metallophosphoesterase family protein [Rhodocyclaceae bacterium]|nr:metallophosphoesterase family protein [Rhodocyclaceae bacterium]